MTSITESIFADDAATLAAACLNAAIVQFKRFLAASASGVVSLKPSGAKFMLESLNFPLQRCIDESRVFTHHHALRTGDWMEGHVITFVELPDGRVWLVDGQHRLTAISRWSDSTPVTIRLVQVESEKEARHFYAGFDQKTSVRTNAQIIDAVGAADESGLSRAMGESVFEASTLLANDLEPLIGQSSVRNNKALFLPSVRMAAIADWAHEARQYEAAIAKAKPTLRKKLMLHGVVAVALYTLRHQPAKALEFWTGTASNDRLASSDPRAALIADLLTRKLNTGSVRQRVQQPISAWNAFFRGRTLSQIKCIPGAALAVAGTPLKAVK